MNCIADPLCFIADGKPGLFNRFLVVGCNTILYLGGVIIAFVWVHLVASHLNTKLHRVHRIITDVVFTAVVLLLVVDLFIPVIFTVDENNVYSRLGGYFIYTAFHIVFTLDGLFLYLLEKYKSGGLKFFPVWAFVIPSTLGILIQFMFYGVSTAIPFTTVSLVCIIISLQNEFIVRDKLTGLYNRFYLNTVEKKLTHYDHTEYTAVMLDINGFKKINDTLGHKVGDEALVCMGKILTNAVGRIGEVVRYAGDEFIIVLNTHDKKHTEEIIARIDTLIEKFNNENIKPFKLSVAMGYCKLNLKEGSMDEFMDKIDKLMYENKKDYYKLNERYSRSEDKNSSKN